MKHIVDFVLRNKLAVWLLTIMVIISGMYSTMQMKMETLPDVTIPYLVVTTPYPGATAEQVMNEVSEPMEEQLKSVSDIKNVYVTSYSNFSSLQVEFNYGVDMDKKEDEIRKIIDKMEFNEQVEESNVLALSMNAMPVIVSSVFDNKMNDAELTDYINNEIVPTLNKIDGIGSVSVSGAYFEEYILSFDDEALATYQLKKEDIKQIIQGNNFYAPLGLYSLEDSKESIVVDNEVTSIKAFEEIVLPVMKSDLTPLTLGDIAKIELKGEVESISRTNGEPSMSIAITKTQEANTVDIVNQVKEIIQDLEKENESLTFNITLDQGEPIEKSVETMLSKALFGAGFAMIIILLFLRNLRSTLISVVSIPLSILIAFLVLKQMDITLNIMTLGAMTVAIGRVIDDSIVVIENIYRRLAERDEHTKPKELIKEATIEMFIPILSSTLVTIAVFLPLGLVDGMVGELFLPFALTMAFSLIASLIVAITLVPVMSHTLFKKELKGIRPVKEENHKGKLTEMYDKALKYTLKHKVITSIATIALLVSSLLVVPYVGFSFMPSEEQKQLMLSYTAKSGSLEATIEEELIELEEVFLKDKNIKSVQANIGSSGMMSMFGASSDASIDILYNEDVEDFEAVKKEVEAELLKHNDKGTWSMSDNPSGASMASNKLSFEIHGNSLQDIEPTVKKVSTILSTDKDLKNINTSLANSYKENIFVVDKEKANELGLSPAMITMALFNYEKKDVYSTVQVNGKEIDVIEISEAKSYKDVKELLDLRLPTATGTMIQIRDVVSIEEGESPLSLTKNDGKYYVTVSATVLTDDVSKVSSRVDKEIDKVELKPGVSIETAGVTADMIEAFTQLALAMLAAIAIVYFILVVTFKEGLAPLAILFSLPLTLIGAIFGLFITGETISISSLLGLLMLIGIVVTNAIVLIDRVIRNEQNGMERQSAIIEAGETRLRPILMTAIATVGALIPLAIGAEGGGLISKGLGITVIGGLISSTILTLFIVPLMYDLLSKLFRKNRQKIDE